MTVGTPPPPPPPPLIPPGISESYQELTSVSYYVIQTNQLLKLKLEIFFRLCRQTFIFKFSQVLFSILVAVYKQLE